MSFWDSNESRSVLMCEGIIGVQFPIISREHLIRYQQGWQKRKVHPRHKSHISQETRCNKRCALKRITIKTPSTSLTNNKNMIYNIRITICAVSYWQESSLQGWLMLENGQLETELNFYPVSTSSMLSFPSFFPFMILGRTAVAPICPILWLQRTYRDVESI